MLFVKGDTYREAEQKLRKIAIVYLSNEVNQKGPTIKDAHELLCDVSTASSLLAARLAQLPAVIFGELRRQSKAHLLHHDPVSQLNDMATAATKIEAALPTRKGGHVTAEAAVMKTFGDREQIGPPDPRDYFLSQSVAVFVQHRGAGAVSSTTSETTDRFYRFASALFRFATGEGFTDLTRFKAFVRRWKERNRPEA
ncbi:hypothetical protein [Aestuariivirga litoralis]|uniref:hypothetical protein n=1 Tax=Aestuariivirga litoralis TaxID=2650924 RepID=UPI000DAA25B1|nr:hypothetical protein [Aestuariivirga litoralis]